MPSTSSPEFPPQALDWLAAGRARPSDRVLALGCSPAYCRMLARRGVSLFAVDRDPRIAATSHRVDGVTGICAMAEALPLDPCSFDAVLVHQAFQKMQPYRVLSEMARVLRPGCCVGVSWMTRDDSVPWVRRLAKLLRSVDAQAMSGDYGTGSVGPLLSSKYFPSTEYTRYRIWVPATRQGMVHMAAALPAVGRLSPDRRAAILAEVEALHDDSAGPGGLLLPYQLECWRAWVSHDELTAPIEVDRSGLTIRL